MASSSSNTLNSLHLAAIDQERARHAKIDGARQDAAKAQSQLGYYRHLEAKMVETFGADVFDGNPALKVGSKRGRQALEADEDVAAATAGAPLALRRSTRVAAAAAQQPPSASTLRTNTDAGAGPAQQTGTQEGPGPSQESSEDKPTEDEHGTADTSQPQAPQDSDAPQTECADKNPACTPLFRRASPEVNRDFLVEFLLRPITCNSFP
ncbi:hypothetical protein DFH06DRAFT_1322570 [Mycena polygramma]|nr:hypothetical protein DFH06DRAFT_1322570 [Mycena polygramma]